MLGLSYKADITPRPGGGFTAQFRGLSGCVCEADTLEELQVNGERVLRDYLSSLTTHGKSTSSTVETIGFTAVIS